MTHRLDQHGLCKRCSKFPVEAPDCVALERFSTAPWDRPNASEADRGESWWFTCPGCETYHSFRTKSWNGEELWNASQGLKTPIWVFNGNLIKPTFSPSLIVDAHPKCHLYLRDGVIEFLNDCTHQLRGKKVPL